MQHVKSFLSFLFPVVLMVPAHAEYSPEAACRQLSELLASEIAVLQSVQDPASATAALAKLEPVLQSLSSMERSYEAEKALWQYIDNTEGVKQPLVELLQRLSIEFARIQQAGYFKSRPLRLMLTPQLVAPKKEEKPAAGK